MTSRLSHPFHGRRSTRPPTSSKRSAQALSKSSTLVLWGFKLTENKRTKGRVSKRNRPVIPFRAQNWPHRRHSDPFASFGRTRPIQTTDIIEKNVSGPFEIIAARLLEFGTDRERRSRRLGLNSVTDQFRTGTPLLSSRILYFFFEYFF